MDLPAELSHSNPGSGPLAGYRIIDLADESGVYGTKLLADLGAEVIRIEPPGGSGLRRLPPFTKDKSGSDLSLYFAYMNTHKQSITLNLDSTEGQGLFRRLCESAHAVFDTSPRRYLAERGIGYEQLCQTNPKLVWVSLTPFGLTGPRRDWKGSDLVAWAATGVLSYNGFPGEPPIVPASSLMLANALGALNAAIGCLIALEHAEITGRGQLVDISIQEAALTSTIEASMPSFLDDLIPRVRFGNRRVWAVPMGLFPCQDGYVYVVPAVPAHWIALAAWIKEKTGSEALSDPLFEDRLVRLQWKEMIEDEIERFTRAHRKQELFEEAQRRGIPVTPANTVADLVSDPQLAARRYWSEMTDPELGRVRMAGAPYQLSETPWQAGRAPLLGEHNEVVYREIGVISVELASLRSRGVI